MWGKPLHLFIFINHIFFPEAFHARVKSRCGGANTIVDATIILKGGKLRLANGLRGNDRSHEYLRRTLWPYHHARMTLPKAAA